MDQTRIGTFIAVLRKEKGLTQKELAEQIGISDKTVSKWETGNGMPDIAYLSPLCEVLDINVNELLSGEKLPSEEYLGKAEENMKHLMQENQNNKNAGRWQGLAGIALLAVAVFLTFGLSQAKIGWYVDCPSLILMVCICTACVFFSGSRTKYEVVHFLRKIVLPVGLLVMVIMVPGLIHMLSDPSTIGPRIAVMVLTLLYASAAYLVLYIIETRMERRRKQN